MKKFFDIQSTDFIPDNLAKLSREELIKILYKYNSSQVKSSFNSKNYFTCLADLRVPIVLFSHSLAFLCFN